MAKRTVPIAGPLINRYKEKEMVEAALKEAVNDEHPQAIFFEFYGLAGVGKTRLLDDNRETANSLGIISVRLDGEDLNRARDGAHVHLTDLIIDQLQGHPGKPAPNIYRDTAKKVLKDIGNTVSPTDQILQPLATACGSYLKSWLEEHVILLILDGTDRFPKELLRWLNQCILEELAGCRKLIVIFAGRTELSSERLAPTIRKLLKSYQLRGFTQEFTRQQLANDPQGQIYQDIAPLLHNLTQGHPKSNLAAIDYLLGRNSNFVPSELSELARYLQAEVIENYIFTPVEEMRLRSVILLLAYPRRFESGLLTDLLRKYYPDLNLDPTRPPAILKLIMDLMQTPLVSYDTLEGGYKLEPLLAKLIQTCDLYTDPQRFADIHSFLTTWHLQLPPDPKPGNNVRSIGDGFYHFIQYLRGMLKCDRNNDDAWAQNQLKQRLQEELERRYSLANSKASEQLNELRDWFEKDVDLGMEFPGMQNILKLALANFMVARRPAPRAILSITLRTQIDVSLNIPDQAIVLQQYSNALSAAGKLQVEEVWQDLETASHRACQRMFGLCIPAAIQTHLRQLSVDAPLQIITNYANQPWELMHDGSEFLCLKLALGRLPAIPRLPKQNEHQRSERPRFLLLADPNTNLPGARREVEAIKNQLGDRADVTVLQGEEVTLRNFFNHLVGSLPFDVIHYAGHATFNADQPSESELVLSDGIVPARDIESTLGYRPLIFLNACEAGCQQSGELPGSYMGSYTEGLVASCLLGGARGCIGPLWSVPDGMAADFAIAFYERAINGASLGAALRQARSQIRGKSATNKVWAAYVLYGDPTVQLL